MTIICLPASAGNTPYYTVGAAVILHGQTASGSSRAEVILRNVGNKPSGEFRIIFYKYWSLGRTPGLTLKWFKGVEHYSQILNAQPNQSLRYPITVKTTKLGIAGDLDGCFGVSESDLATGASVVTTACARSTEPFELGMFVAFPRVGHSPNLTVTVHNYGRSRSAPFYLWLGPTVGWTHVYAGVPAGADRVVHVLEPMYSKEYIVTLGLTKNRAVRPYVTDQISQGLK
ncbi:MAG TPA: hypothetical protein VFP32_03030 [Candidatus Saccharimonadales bacterium]|nr:hypothetical protein [Candidatus Saccharimonadales bacterium]